MSGETPYNFSIQVHTLLHAIVYFPPKTIQEVLRNLTNYGRGEINNYHYFIIFRLETAMQESNLTLL